MSKEVIEVYVQNQIKSFAKQYNASKDTLVALKKLFDKCRKFTDILDHAEEIPDCDINGLDGAKMFIWWRALDIVQDVPATVEELPTTINAYHLNNIWDPVNFSRNRVFNFTTPNPEYPNVYIVAECQWDDAVIFGFTYNDTKVLKHFSLHMNNRKIHEFLRNYRVKLLPEDDAFKCDLIKFPVKTQRLLAAYAMSKMLVQRRTYEGPYGKCTYSDRYIEERTDEFGNPALYQIYKYYGGFDGEYDYNHMHLGDLNLSHSFYMHELLCMDIAYSSCVKPINLAGYDRDMRYLFNRATKQKPANWKILEYLREQANGELGKLPCYAVLDCQTKEAADELLALLNE